MSTELLSGEYNCPRKFDSSYHCKKIKVSENAVNCSNIEEHNCSYVPTLLDDLVDDPGKGSMFFFPKEDLLCDVWKQAHECHYALTHPKCTGEKSC